jgi:Domain of unknown function (DUF4371)/hAT family C-terminal dimerisation region
MIQLIAFIFYLFKQQVRGEKFGYEVFTQEGFNNWRKALEAFKNHVGGVNSCHNYARRVCQDFKNQKQSVSYVLSAHSKEAEIAYRIRLTSILHITRHLCFSLVYRLIELALILPVATTTIERAFSAMNIIKIKLRNKMGDEWMNDNMVCYIEREIFITIDDERIL